MVPKFGFDWTDFGFWQTKAVSLIVAGYKRVSSPAVPTTKLQRESGLLSTALEKSLVPRISWAY